ncbi:MAG: ureidoglycolate lyase [Pseudomonadota bacterium]
MIPAPTIPAPTIPAPTIPAPMIPAPMSSTPLTPAPLTPTPLTPAAFAPFGEVLGFEGQPSFAFNAGMAVRWHARALPSAAEGRVAISLARAEPRTLPMILALVERHPLGSQAFMPLSPAPFLVVVAPDRDGVPGAPLAFLTDGRQGVNYRAGTWHGLLAPLAGTQEFLIVDRDGAGTNLEEHHYATPYTILAPSA